MTKESILLVEDEHNVASFIQLELEHEGYIVEVAYDGEQGWEFAREDRWDLILLDWMLPKLDGLEICRRIRKITEVPVILLTARDYVGDKIAGLDTGADDYVTKPFEIEELLARIRVNIRRTKQHKISKQDTQVLQVEDLVVNPIKRLVSRANIPIQLSQREFELLSFLMNHPDEVLSRDYLVSAVWGFDYTGETNIVDVYIRYLRNKIDRDHEPKLIHTVRGVGYVLRTIQEQRLE
ncbi:response regulator transcription factor [Aquibacillus sp. 3ASR75-11]|uniref:Response regulator transcription factor n=1 Tax=Terrihalobacillus insolitus TaxID=2950438 RepID=A0A9X3WRN9_9BACI|nr:response regulator transcription factor [Terrihalobacillus insolitus]MDC3413833.1 response regulator transcription factor [Terrihalobacillus insolitus]MDC3424520.1 response regulator transcription factor [Terrihalobacillus insolitus]